MDADWQAEASFTQFHHDNEIADLRKALAASQEELEEWRFTNKIDELQRLCDAKQAKIDALMLEFCPEEMTPEQVKTWGEHQRAVPGSHPVYGAIDQMLEERKQEAIDAARYRWLRDLKANSFSITRNDDHAINYVTAKEWIENMCPDDFANDPTSEVQAMKDSNTIWRLQIYPHTPIGFSFWNGATLDFVIDTARAEQIAKESK